MASRAVPGCSRGSTIQVAREHFRRKPVKTLNRKLMNVLTKGEEGQSYAYGGGGVVLILVVVLLVLLLR